MTVFAVKYMRVCVAVSLFASNIAGQNIASRNNGQRAPAAVEDVGARYTLSPDDEITIRSLLVKEIMDKSFRVERTGEVNVPLLGRVQVGGRTVEEAERLLITKLKQFYVEPDIAVVIAALHAEPVSVIGAVGTPGIHQLRGRTTLLTVLSAAGGVRTDAGPVVTITRQRAYGTIPGARRTADGDSVAEIALKTLLEARDPDDNIELKPHDLISIPVAEVVYVVGNVKRAGGFSLGGKPALTVLQALSLAEGLDNLASPKRARILRKGKNKTERTEVLVNVQRIMGGKADDILLQPNDILFIPSSTAKVVSARSINAAIQLGTQALIFH